MYELVIILLIGIDQLIKNWALNVLRYKGAISVIENVFNLTYVENRGAAFGLFQKNQIIFILVALIASIVAILHLNSKKPNNIYSCCAYCINSRTLCSSFKKNKFKNMQNFNYAYYSRGFRKLNRQD